MLAAIDAWRSCAVAAQVAASAWAGGEALAALRAQRLTGLLAAAASGSPLYRRLLRGRDLSSLQLRQLPIMRKAELMARFEDWVTDPALRLDALRRFTADPKRIGEPYLGRYTVWESSGSTGEPGVFVQDAGAMAVYDALEALRRPSRRPLQTLLDPWGLRERIAFVGATGGHFAGTVSIERLRRLNPALAGSLHSISFMQSPHDLAQELEALAPTVVATYPSAAVLLAEEHAAGRLRIAPQEIWTGGETLSPSMRHFVQQAFGCPVADSYGASEFLSLAFECRHGALHLNSDWAILESVDDHGHAVPDGEQGATVLLTNLANHVQPVIRYDLGDRVTLHAQACTCGSALPTLDVRGRDDDTLRLASGGGRTVGVLPLALSTVMEDEAGLFDFQLEQQGPSDLLLTTGLDGPDADAALARARDSLGAFLTEQGTVGVHIHCRCNQAGRRGRSGKSRRVIAAPPEPLASG